jgi:opine dehydrogenase
MARKVAILGAGNGGQTMAADLSVSGHEVRLFELERFAGALGPLFEKKHIKMTGFIEGEADIAVITTDIDEAISGAEVIFIPLPAFTHRTYAELLADHVKDGQIIVLVPGTLGSLVFRRVFDEKGVTADVIICETNSLTYDTRIVAPGEVHVFATNPGLKLGVMPKEKTPEVFRFLSEFFEFEEAEDVLDCGLHSLNPVLHVPGCILNAGRIERSKGEFYLYEEGITPRVVRVMESIEEERANIVDRLGYKLMTLAEELAEGREPRTIWEEVNGCETLEFIKGPSSFDNRYFTEDIPYGLLAWTELADIIGVKTPTMNALLQLGSLLIDVDPRKVGRTKEDMGIAGMDIAAIKQYVERR